MRVVKLFTFALASAAMLVTPAARAQGLYDTGANATSGELNNQDYWWARFDAMMLEIAIQTRQPEGRIAVDIASSLRRLDDLAKKFPKHQEIAKMRARFQEIDGKINPNANRGESFSKECPWDEANFAQLWVNLHWGKVAYDQKDYSTTVSCLSNVMQNYNIMLAPDRMKFYPEALRKYVIDNKGNAEALYKAAKERRG
jgi:hypothetical protein